jgi:hypothetical protein
MEGIRRCRALGARIAYVGGAASFYQAWGSGKPTSAPHGNGIGVHSW